MIAHEIDRWASVMHAARPDWRHDSLRTFATNHLAAKPYRDALVAGVWVASDGQARTPNLLTQDGPWWSACQPTPGAHTEPGIVTYCEHGQPGTTCPTCYPRTGTGAIRTPEQRAAIQQAIADTKTHLATLATDKDQR